MSSFQGTSFKSRDAKNNASGSKETTRIKRLGSGSSFKARPLPKKTLAATPAAMKQRRAIEEKQRQQFRTKVESFYNSKPELQSKWEKARDTLLVKYSSGTKWKTFNMKLIEKYGDEFFNFEPSASDVNSINKETVDGRVPCSYCSRKFVLSRVFEHETICARTKKGRGGSRRKKVDGGYSKKFDARKVEVEETGFTEEEEHEKDDEEEEEEEEEEERELARAEEERKNKLAGMSEIEQLEYQLSEMKRFQALQTQ